MIGSRCSDLTGKPRCFVVRPYTIANYGVSFPMFAKIEVNGAGAHPLYDFLKSEKAGVLGTRNIKWNFTKFLVDRDGKVVGRFAPATKPKDIEEAIAKVL